MQDYYNMNQTTLSIALDYQPEDVTSTSLLRV